MQRPAQPISSWLISSCLHVTALSLLLLAAAVVGPPPPLPPHIIKVPLEIRLPAPRLQQQESGGGQRLNEPAPKGRLPEKPVRRVFLPPMVAVNEQPRLVMPVGLIDAPDLDAAIEVIGDPSSLFHGPGGGPGCCRGIGASPNGGGIGEDAGDGYSGRALPKEKLTRTPQVIYKEEPEYSEPARRAKVQGYVRLRIDVGIDGRPVNIRVEQAMGLGLDENAIEAVKRWRFRPALIGDRPVVAPALVEVGFHLL